MGFNRSMQSDNDTSFIKINGKVDYSIIVSTGATSVLNVLTEMLKNDIFVNVCPKGKRGYVSYFLGNNGIFSLNE